MGGLIILEQIIEEEGPVIEEEAAAAEEAIVAEAEALAPKVEAVAKTVVEKAEAVAKETEAEGEAILNRIGEALGEGNVEEVEESCVAEAPEVTSLTSESTGVTIEPTPGKTTTVLGRYQPDMKSILDQLGAEKSSDFGPKTGGFNVLNVEAPVDMSAEEFWTTYNKPFLDQAMARGDKIALATQPTPTQLTNALGEPTMFGREISYLQENGYTYDSVTNSMTKH